MDARGKSKPRGFINAHGSSCYMSVILQVILSEKTLVLFLLCFVVIIYIDLLLLLFAQILFYNETFREGINTKQRGKSAQILSDLQKVFNLLAVSTSR